MSTIASHWTGDVGMSPSTAGTLDRFARRRRFLLVVRAIAAGVLTLIVSMLLIVACDFLWILSDPVRWSLGTIAYLMALGSSWWLGLRHIGRLDPRVIARQLESADPRLREDLLSAVELSDPAAANGSDSFRRQLQSGVAHRTSLIDVGNLLPIGLVYRWLMACAVIVSICGMLMLLPKAQFARRFARAMLPGIAIERASLTVLTIEAPSPASRFVARDDAIAVIVSMGGVRTDDIILQWRSSGRERGETPMSPRMTFNQDPESTADVGDRSAADIATQRSERFAANLMVAGEPVQYRVIAGDAVTLWHTLTPLPRPRVTSFTKRYEYPTYAKLPDRIEEAEHGDLQALVGTRAMLTVRFDEPVFDAKLRFGFRGPVYPMTAVEGSTEVFSTSIPIKTSSQYQIDATSAQSDLNNPFSPQYTVTPIIDRAPVIEWAADQVSTMLVSPLEVVNLSAIATDDLPIDRIVQEYQLNRQPLTQRQVTVDQPGRQIDVFAKWDLLHRDDDSVESVRLAGGDVIQTRLVAIDRLGNRGESTFIEILVAGESFNPDRHQHLHSVGELTDRIIRWTQRTAAMMESAKDQIKDDGAAALDQIQSDASELAETTDGLMRLLRRQVSDSQSISEARTIELAGRGLLQLDSRIRTLAESLELVVDQSHPAWQTTGSKQLRQLSSDARSIAQQATRIEQLARSQFAQQFSVGIADDMGAVRRSLDPLIESSDADQQHSQQTKSLPIERFGRYLIVVSGRLTAIDEMLKQHASRLPESTRRFFEQWTIWSSAWATRFRDLPSSNLSEDQVRNLVKQFAAEADRKYAQSMIDGRVASTMQQMVREIQSQIGPLSDLIDRMKKQGQTLEQLNEKLAKENNSDATAQLIRDARVAKTEFEAARRQFLSRAEGEESLHRNLPSVDLRYAADLNLIGRAIKNVTESGFAPYRNESAVDVHDQLSAAFELLEAYHEATMAGRELREIHHSERFLQQDAVAKLDHPFWLERFSAVLEWPVQVLKQNGIEWAMIEPIDRVRYDENYNRARDRLTKRRWSSDDMISAEASLRSMDQQLSGGLASLQSKVDEARATILRYVLSLPELAAQAADAADVSNRIVQSRKDDSKKTADELQMQQSDTFGKTKDALESLIDLANTSDASREEARALARDADAASAQIQDAMRQAETAIDSATQTDDAKARSESIRRNGEALKDLSEALRQTSEHFARAAAGEDVSDSRAALREAEQTLQIDQQLEQRFERAKAMSNAAESSPEELLRKLEQELERNETMREELSEIAMQAVENSQRALEQSAREEAGLNQTIERSDAAFAEFKSRTARQLANLAKRADTVDQALLNAAERAAGAAQSAIPADNLKLARENLRKVTSNADQVDGKQASMQDLRATATQMADAIADSQELLAELAKQADDASQKPIAGDDQERRQREAGQFERIERDTRTQRSRAAGRESQDWSAAGKDAGKRIQQAQRQLRDAERTKKDTESRIQKSKQTDPKDALQRQLAQADQRVEDARKAEAAGRESLDMAKQKEAEAAEREKQLERQRLDELDAPNPAAQLTERMARQASEELDEIRSQLKRLDDVAGAIEKLRLRESEAESLSTQQDQIAQDVDQTARQLERAARHEERLKNHDQAARLDEAAKNIDQTAAKAARSATESLNATARTPEKTPEANAKVQTARDQIEAAAAQLGSAFKSSASANETDRTPKPPSSSEQQSQQLAQTLDELDQSIAEANRSGQPGNSPQPPAPEMDQSDTAGQASPTLANLMDAQSQSAARQRQQQLDPSSMGDGQPSDASSPPAGGEDSAQGDPNDALGMAGNPGTESGSGEMPGGGAIDSSKVQRLGEAWGSLRQRRTEDAAEASLPTVPPQYRREIEAYFRAVAGQAAKDK